MTALQDGVELATLMVRDQRKQHNKKRWVEGRKQAAGRRAVMIDDFMGMGSALDLVEEALAADQHDLRLCGIALFFDIWNPRGARQSLITKEPDDLEI